jgi:predicted DNA-binding transcriptional regulator AlpA
MSTSISTRDAYRARLLEELPPAIDSAKVASLLGIHQKTIQRRAKRGALPFQSLGLGGKESPLSFLTVDVVEWMFARSAGQEVKAKKGGRPVGSKNKDKTQPEVMGA